MDLGEHKAILRYSWFVAMQLKIDWKNRWINESQLLIIFRTENCYVRTFFIVPHHHSKRAVLCIDMPYTIQRLLCVTNGHYCATIMVQWPLWPSRTYRASWADTQLHCVGTRHSDLAIPCPFLHKRDMCRLRRGSKQQHNKSVVSKGSLLLYAQLLLFSVGVGQYNLHVFKPG
jgi:hypothetical protein